MKRLVIFALLFSVIKLAEAQVYSTINGGVIWPASGTWSFTDDTAKVIARNDGIHQYPIRNRPGVKPYME